MLLPWFASSRCTVQFQHIYSHIDQKLHWAAARGKVDKLQATLETLKNELWGPFEAWVKGNEGAN